MFHRRFANATQVLFNKCNWQESKNVKNTLNKVEIRKMVKIEVDLVRKNGLKYLPCFFPSRDGVKEKVRNASCFVLLLLVNN